MEAWVQELFRRRVHRRVQEKEKPGRPLGFRASRTGGRYASVSKKEGRGFSVFGADAPALGPQEICLEEMSGREKGEGSTSLGVKKAFSLTISVIPRFCFSRRDHRRVHQGEWLRPGGGAAGPGRGAAAPGVSRGGLPEHGHPGPRGAPAPGHAAALGLPPGPAGALGSGPRAAAAPGHHRAAQAARHALPLRVRGPLGRQHPRGEQHRGQQDAARHRGGHQGRGRHRGRWDSRVPRPEDSYACISLFMYFMVVIIIAVAIFGADDTAVTWP